LRDSLHARLFLIKISYCVFAVDTLMAIVEVAESRYRLLFPTVSMSRRIF